MPNIKDYRLFRFQNVGNDFWAEGSFVGVAWANIPGTTGKTEKEARSKLKFLLWEQN